MTTPTTYADWAIVLERFGAGDDTVLTEMNTGSFVLDAGTAQRFYTRVEEVYKKRKQTWLNKFERSFQVQQIRTDDDFGIALRNGKQNLLPISRFISAKGLPEDLRKTLQTDLFDFIAEIKKSMQDNVSKTNKSREKILVLLRAFGLPGIQYEEPAQKKPGKKQEENDPVSTGRRKIIF